MTSCICDGAAAAGCGPTVRGLGGDVEPVTAENGEPSLTATAASAAVWATGQVWGVRVLTLATYVVLARLLSPADFGVVAIALVVVSLAQVLQEQGLSQAIVQRPDLSRAHVDAAFWCISGVSALLAGLVAGSALMLDRLVDGSSDLRGVLLMLSPVILLSGGASVPTALLQRDLRHRALAARTLVSALLGSAVGIVAAVLGLGPYALVLQVLAATVAGLVALIVTVDWRPSPRFSRAAARDMAAVGSALAGMQVLNEVRLRAPVLVVGALHPIAAVGLLSAGQRLHSTASDTVFAAVNAVALPAFSRARGDAQRLRRGMLVTLRAGSLAAVPTFGTLAMFAGDLVPLLLGEEWTGAGGVVSVLAVGGLVQVVTLPVHWALIASGRTRVPLLAAIAALALLFPLLLLLRSDGAVGAAAAMVLVTVVLTPVLVLDAVRGAGVLTLADIARALRPAALAGAALVATALLVRPVLGLDGVAAWASALIAGVVVYLLIVARTLRSLWAEARMQLRGEVTRSPARLLAAATADLDACEGQARATP